MEQPFVYLDNAGSLRVSPVLAEAALTDVFAASYGNPHSRNKVSLSTLEVVSQTRLRILSHFNTTSDAYSVIFTSGATAALKLLAETFPWQSDCPQCCHLVHRTSSNFSDVLNLRLGEDSSLPGGSVFAYLADNHTSVVGMREYALNAGASAVCVEERDILRLFGSETPAIGTSSCSCRSLFVYPGQSNFCGQKYPVDWITAVQMRSPNGGQWSVCVDAAALLATDTIDLSRYPADFLVVSFYKIFGYPTGIGALLAKNSVAVCLRKKYFGGGSAFAYLPGTRFYKPRDSFEERFEDGTIAFQQVASLLLGFDELTQKSGGMVTVRDDLFRLSKSAYTFLSTLKHFNDSPVAQLYCSTDFQSPHRQGPIVNFNLKSADGHWIGYGVVERLADACNVCLRTGCFCNIGACQRYLGLSDLEVMANYEVIWNADVRLLLYHRQPNTTENLSADFLAQMDGQHGKHCGDAVDILNGKPVGSVRISFGRLSTEADLDGFVNFISSCFVERCLPMRVTPAIANTNFQEQEIFYDCVSTADQRDASVSGLFVYPIKSCRPMKVDRWPAIPSGLMFDRHWTIVDGESKAVTLKQLSALISVQPFVDTHNGLLELSAISTVGRFEKLRIPIEPEGQFGNHVKTKVCMRRVTSTDCGREVSKWLDGVLNSAGLRLVRCSETDSEHHSFASRAQYLLINGGTARHFRDVLAADGVFYTETELVARFRPNLVISGSLPFHEETWKRIKIGKICFECIGTCSRCQMICVDPQTGSVDDRLLKSLRKWHKNELIFGIYLAGEIPEDRIEIRCGDPVEVIEFK